MKKIAFIIQHLTNGGAERTISNLSIQLKGKCDISLIVFNGGRITYPYQGKLFDLKLPPRKTLIGKIQNIVKRVLMVRKIKRENNFDCTISFMFGANIVNVLSKGKEKVIVSARNYMSVYGTGIREKFRERFIARHSYKEVTLSKGVELDLHKTFGVPKDKLVTIYNPCDKDRIQELAGRECEYQFDESCFYVVNAGRFVEQKGQWHLLRAFSEFHREVPLSKLLMLGDGKLRETLKSFCSELGIEDSVDFIGFVDNPFSYISRCDVFVLSSLFEGLGNVLIEAMACGVPVVSYDCLAGPREVIAPESSLEKQCCDIEIASCGILVPPEKNNRIELGPMLTNSEKLLSKAIGIIHDNPDLADILCAASQDRLKEFGSESILEQWFRLIN